MPRLTQAEREAAYRDATATLASEPRHVYMLPVGNCRVCLAMELVCSFAWAPRPAENVGATTILGRLTPSFPNRSSHSGISEDVLDRHVADLARQGQRVMPSMEDSRWAHLYAARYGLGSAIEGETYAALMARAEGRPVPPEPQAAPTMTISSVAWTDDDPPIPASTRWYTVTNELVAAPPAPTVCAECDWHNPAPHAAGDRRRMYRWGPETGLCEVCVILCAHCETAGSRDEMVEVVMSRDGSQHRLVCEACYWTCAGVCDEAFSNAIAAVATEDGRVCPRCADSYRECSACESRFHCDGDAWNDGCDGYCASCYADRQNEDSDESRGDSEDGRLIHDHSFKPRPIFNKAKGERERPHMPFFGVELEVEAAHNRSVEHYAAMALDGLGRDFAYLKHDGSIAYGFEIVSHPATVQAWRGKDLSAFNRLAKGGCRSYKTETCGMHVHFSRDSLSKFGAYKMLRFFKENQGLILAISRRKPDNLERWSAIDSGPTHGGRGMGRTMNTQGREILTHKALYGNTHDYRYSALNMANRNTVEVRIFRATLNVRSFLRNIEIVNALIHFCAWSNPNRLSGAAFVRWLERCGAGRDMLGASVGDDLLAWVAPLVSGNDDALLLADREDV